jgi:hypothetical protein
MLWLKKLWTDPVGSKVVAWAIIGLIGVAMTLWIPGLLSIFRSLWLWITADFAVPRWLFLLLSGYSLITLVLIIQAWLSSYSGVPEAPITQRDYTKDRLYGLVWSWQYSTIDDSIIGLATFCPKCDYQLFGCESRSFRLSHPLEYCCPECGYATTHREE